MPQNRIYKLQQRAAACTDELLDISEEISRCVLPLYTGKDRSMFDLQCRLQLERCRQLAGELEQVSVQLREAADGGEAADDSDAANGRGAADELTQVRRQSARITLQLIAQNQAILEQKRALLGELLVSSGETQSRLRAAQTLQDTADAAALRGALRKELDRCRTADGNSN